VIRVRSVCKNDTDSLHKEMASIKTDILRMQTQVDEIRAAEPKSATPLWPSLQSSASREVTAEEAVLAAVHSELSDKQRRACNVVVSGLKSVDGVHDADLFLSLCEVNLPVKPHIDRTKCRRLGKEQSGKIQPLLITLPSAASAHELLNCAPQLRRSDDPVIKSTVYINPDRTPAELLSAYNERVRKRQRRSGNRREGEPTAEAQADQTTTTPTSS